MYIFNVFIRMFVSRQAEEFMGVKFMVFSCVLPSPAFKFIQDEAFAA